MGRWCTAAVIIAQPIEAPTSAPHRADEIESFNRRLFALYDEAFLLLSLQHPNIITLFGVTVVSPGERRRLPALIMEAALQTLDAKLSDSFTDITSSEKLRMMKDIACALTYLHDRGVTHNDIKADNILVARDGHTLKIADLSSVRTYDFSPSMAAPEIIARHLGSAERQQAYRVARHQRRVQDAYLNPQWQNTMDAILRTPGPPASKEADVYSCGLVFCKILTGELCIYEVGNQTLLSLFLLKLTLPPSHYRDQATGCSGEAIVSAIADCFDEEVGGQLLSMVQRCYLAAASVRPTARELLEIISSLDIDDCLLAPSPAHPSLNHHTADSHQLVAGSLPSPILCQ